MLYTIKCEDLEATISSYGAELHSLKRNGYEYLWQAGRAWQRHAPLLFPFICSPTGKAYNAGGREYIMQANHGFARDMEFELIQHSDEICEFVLKDNSESLAQYPYNFKLYVKYFFENKRLATLCRVENTGDNKMYFYLGGHPAFNCPLESGLTFDDYFVEYEKPELIEQQAGGSLRTVLSYDRKLALTRELFDYDVIMKDLPQSRNISLRTDKGERYVTLYYPDGGCIAVWSPTGNDEARFVCLEPWTSVPVYCDDAQKDIEQKLHAVCLEGGGEFEYRYDIEVG